MIQSARRLLLVTVTVLAVECAAAFAGPHFSHDGESSSVTGRLIDPPADKAGGSIDRRRPSPASARASPSLAPPRRIRVHVGGVDIDAAVDSVTGIRLPNGAWQPIDPPSTARAVWLTQSALPGPASKGTTVLYGHACQGMACVFNELLKIEVGDDIELDTVQDRLTYRVTEQIELPKSGPASLATRPSIAKELLLVTCAYQPDGSSADNLVVVAHLVHADRP